MNLPLLKTCPLCSGERVGDRYMCVFSVREQCYFHLLLHEEHIRSVITKPKVRYVRGGSKFCGCGNPRRRSGQYCLECHAAYLRNWRKTHPLKGEARQRSNARSYLHVYLKRGKVVRIEECQRCGKSPTQAHHEDYSKPLEVEWLCVPCHLGETFQKSP